MVKRPGRDTGQVTKTLSCASVFVVFTATASAVSLLMLQNKDYRLSVDDVRLDYRLRDQRKRANFSNLISELFEYVIVAIVIINLAYFMKRRLEENFMGIVHESIASTPIASAFTFLLLFHCISFLFLLLFRKVKYSSKLGSPHYKAELQTPV